MKSTLLEYGVQSTSKSRQISSDDLKNFDFIFVMDKSNFENCIKLSRDALDIKKVQLITDFTTGHFSKYNHVPDPYYGGDSGFIEVYKLLDHLCDNILKLLSK